MRTRILFSHKLLFCLVTLSLLFCDVFFNVADAVSVGTVDFVGSEISANIPKGAHYQHEGPRKVSSNVEVTPEGDRRRVVLAEKWKAPLGKAPDITVFTFKATAKGQGRILLTINRDDGGATTNRDVGSYRGPHDPSGLDDEKPFYVYQHVPHENIREYEDGFDSPYDDDCVPVKHKGYDLEVVTGEEELDAVGKAFAEKVSIAYGGERSAQQALGLTAGWDSAEIEAGFANGTRSTWGWKLVAHTENYSGDSMDSSFRVTVNDSVYEEQGQSQGPACEVCDNCGDFVHNKNDHYLGLCPIDTLYDQHVDGCGAKRYSCDTLLQRNWHEPRDCTNTDFWSVGECFIMFRHCTNSDCFYRGRHFKKGHSDGTTSQAPSNVTNAYANSHLSDDPPAMHVCSVHESWQSGDHSWVTPTCGDVTHAGYACQIDSTHTNLQASCTVTDSNGNTCTITNFYTCQYHIHQYPAPAPAPTPAPAPEMHPCETHPVTEPGDHSNLVCRWCGVGYNPCLSFSGECSYFDFHAPLN